MRKIFYFALLGLTLLNLTACGTTGSSPDKDAESELPDAIPVQFQGWWKGKSDWDYMRIAADGFVQTFFPQRMNKPFNPAFANPNSASYFKVVRNQGDTIYAISKEQRLDPATKAWLDPVYYYVTLHYNFETSVLTYTQQPCGLKEADMKKPAEEHVRKMTSSACMILEDSAGQRTWKRTTTYYRS